MDLAHALDIFISEVTVDGVRHAADQEIFSEKIHHLIMQFLVQGLPCFKLATQRFDGERIHAICEEEFLEIQWVHLHTADAPHWNGGCL